MISLLEYKFDIQECDGQLQDLKIFLDQNSSIGESGEQGLLKFFADRPSLILLLGYWHFGLEPFYYKAEVNLFNEFRADFVVANRRKDKFVFIEFEDAKEDSIFKLKSSISYEWSSRYEHGVSQVVDWYYRMDDYERTSKFQEYFGTQSISYSCLVIIGRDQFLNTSGLKQRFLWRSERTIINSKSLHCMTFDQLLIESTEKLETLQLNNELD